jgi:tetratricopeptide (TPR) repeat protein
MRNKYDIYSLDTSPSESQRREKIKNDIGDQKRETFNVRSLFRYLIIWFVIGACSLFVIRIAINSGTNMVIQKLDPYRDFSDLRIQGDRCFNIGDYDNAIKYYTEAITWASSRRRNSMVGITCFYRGNCYLASGDLDLALSDYELACELKPIQSRKVQSNEVQDMRVKLCLYFAQKSFDDNDIPNVIHYCERALSFNEQLILNWKWKIHTQLRICIYEARILFLSDNSNKEIIQADSIWLEINKEYLQNDNAAYTRRTPSIYAALDSNFDLSNAELNYDQGNYKSAISYLENVIKKDEYKKTDQATQEKFQTLIQLLQSIP